MLLALDTSTLQAGVALLGDDGRPLALRHDRVTTHSERLLPLIDAVLAEAAARPDSLTAIACGAGPGSFTGLRIGLATAKGLCLALKRPLLLVSSLQALALRAPPGALAVAAIDAFKGEVYAGFYRRALGGDGDGLLPAAPAGIEVETVLPPQRLAERLSEAARSGPVHLIGDVLAAWPLLAVPGVDCSDREPPHAVDIGRLARARLARGESDDPAAAVPSYIRPSEAEIKGPRPYR